MMEPGALKTNGNHHKAQFHRRTYMRFLPLDILNPLQKKPLGKKKNIDIFAN